MELFEERENKIKEYQKSQAVRLYDIILLAPFLLYIAFKKGKLNKWDKIGVGFIGITTILYNGRNYWNNKNR